MLYRSIDDLPEGIKHSLPKLASTLYMREFNQVHAAYQAGDSDDDSRAAAHRAAWAAVKRSYEKSQNGCWHRSDRT